MTSTNATPPNPEAAPTAPIVTQPPPARTAYTLNLATWLGLVALVAATPAITTYVVDSSVRQLELRVQEDMHAAEKDRARIKDELDESFEKVTAAVDRLRDDVVSEDDASSAWAAFMADWRSNDPTMPAVILEALNVEESSDTAAKVNALSRGMAGRRLLVSRVGSFENYTLRLSTLDEVERSEIVRVLSAASKTAGGPQIRLRFDIPPASRPSRRGVTSPPPASPRQ